MGVGMDSTVKTAQTCLSGSVEKRLTLLTGERGQPDNNYHCVHMYHNEQHKWQTKKCSIGHRSICEKGLFRFFVVFILLVENKIQSNDLHR